VSDRSEVQVISLRYAAIPKSAIVTLDACRRPHNTNSLEVTRNERIRIGFLIHDVSRLRRTAFDQRMKPLGITRSQWWVLTGVSRHGEEGITQTELANVLDLGKVSLGGLIDRLEERGFVDRRSDERDRRINRIHLTAKGSTTLAKMQKIGMEMNAKVMSGISLLQQHKLAQMLHSMKANLIAMDVVPGSKERRNVAESQTKASGRRSSNDEATYPPD
jgi:MarR family transcriptional regulator, transcriptional regulator for hemolysin